MADSNTTDCLDALFCVDAAAALVRASGHTMSDAFLIVTKLADAGIVLAKDNRTEADIEMAAMGVFDE